MKYDANVIKSTATPPRWQDLVKEYQTPDLTRSILQICNTFLPLVALYYAMYLSLSVSYWLTMLLAFPTAGLVTRLFIIQHDCGHGSFFKSARANDVVGTLCGFVTLIPYYQWRHEHAIHHATSGDLARRGVGDITTLTVAEYKALSPWGRFSYRIYRNSLVMLLIGPFVIFGLNSRLVGKHAGKRERNGVYLTNLAVVSVWVLLSYLIGIKAVVSIWLPTFMISGAAGVWLFYVQHQYEGTYWQRGGEWDYATAALMGSSYFKLPRVLQWFSGNIGFHHIHHLSPKIPNYKLEDCHKKTPLSQEVKVLTMRTSLRSAGLKLWDEDRQRMVRFNEV
ncbi:MAG: fatty acid desaturase [Acidobacteriota bacterium]